jgi:hypothetical protein
LEETGVGGGGGACRNQIEEREAEEIKRYKGIRGKTKFGR